MSIVFRSLMFVVLMTYTVLVQAEATTTSEYYSLKPPFIVNVKDGEKIRHMQITTQLYTKDYTLISHLDAHKPAIQHALVMLFSSKEVKEVKTVQGKEKLRQDAIAAVQKVMTESVGIPVVEEVYFTEFVIQ